MVGRAGYDGIRTWLSCEIRILLLGLTRGGTVNCFCIESSISMLFVRGRPLFPHRSRPIQDLLFHMWPPANETSYVSIHAPYCRSFRDTESILARKVSIKLIEEHTPDIFETPNSLHL